MFGFLNLHKPAGVTSRTLVDRVERLAPRKLKVGHAGTLDPLATGVLVIAIGPATRLVPRIHQFSKSYRAEFELGLRSDTDDIDGQLERGTNVCEVPREAVECALEEFRGTILQTPPRHSAVKVGGRRAYEMARAGEAVELKPREVTVHRLELAGWAWPRFVLNVECSSGTYIRSIGRDLGERLGTGAVMTSLVRTCVGPFLLEQALAPETLTRCSIRTSLIDPVIAAPDYRPVVLSEADVTNVRHGMPVAMENASFAEPVAPVAAVDENQRLVALGAHHAATRRFVSEMVFESF